MEKNLGCKDVIWELPRNSAKVVLFDNDSPIGIRDFPEL